MSAPKNPTAFPGKRHVGGRSGPDTNGEWQDLFAFDGGMTLRDWFAGQALAGDLASQGEATGEWQNTAEDHHIAARAAFFYRFADAMLVERERRP